MLEVPTDTLLTLTVEVRGTYWYSTDSRGMLEIPTGTILTLHVV